MSKMKELIERLEEIGTDVNPLELQTGKQVLLNNGRKAEVIKIHNEDSEHCKNFGMEGIEVLPVGSFVSFNLWFDTPSLRREGVLGRDLLKIKTIL